MQKVLFYPYNPRYDWIFDIQNDGVFDSVKAIKFNEEIRENNQHKEKIKSEEQFEKELLDATIFWIVPTEIDIDFDEYILPKVTYAAEHRKKILYTRESNENEKYLLEKLIPRELYVENEIGLHDIIQHTRVTYDIDVPVISVMGISKKINSVEQLVKLKKQFENMGYKTILFSDASEILLVKDGYFLSMLSEYGISNTDRMLRLNHFVKEVEVHESPDVIIMGIMNGAATLGRNIIEDFGIDIYSVSHVIKPDCVIMNLFYGEYQPDMLEKIGDNLSGIIGGEIDFYNITNQIMDNKESELLEKVCTLEVDYQKVEGIIKKLSQINVYKLQREDEFKKLTDAIIDKLSEYAEVVSV